MAENFLTGSVERIGYFNGETGQCVIEVKPENSKSNLFVSGRVPSIYPGQTVEITGGNKISVKTPGSKRTLKKFLKSGALIGLGSHMASLLAETFPDNLLFLLDKNSEKIEEVRGVGKKRKIQITDAWNRFKALTSFREFLFQEGLPLSWGTLLFMAHGTQSLSLFKKNPYQMGREHFLPFDLLDVYALKSGWSPLSPERLRLGLQDFLHGQYKQGNCAFPEAQLIEETVRKWGVPFDAVEQALEMELIEGNFVQDFISGVPCIYLKKIWDLEREVARKLLKFEKREPPWGWINLQRVLSWAQSLLNIQLAPLQIQAIETALSSSLTVITGGPGTGKTTLIQSLITILRIQFSRIALCSPTGRAAQRLEEATHFPAQTIHRLLKYKSDTEEFGFGRHRPLDLDLVLIDEVSMVDLSLMSRLLDALPSHCALILVGDADQIPPVAGGSVLQSIIASSRFNTVRLTEVFRQREKSLIKINAHRINFGEMPLATLPGAKDFHYFPVHGIDETKQVILNLVTNVIPKQYGITNLQQFQILVPMNQGPLGTLKLNEELQELASNGGQNQIESHNQKFKEGDKVMIVKNDYKKNVFNGDVGFIQNINHLESFVDVQLERQTVRFTFDELESLTLAYAITIHKSQGSEYRAVVVVIAPEHTPMVQRHLVYTAVTRGKEHVFLVADPSALHTALSANEVRWQKLTELLRIGD